MLLWLYAPQYIIGLLSCCRLLFSCLSFFCLFICMPNFLNFCPFVCLAFPYLLITFGQFFLIFYCNWKMWQPLQIFAKYHKPMSISILHRGIPATVLVEARCQRTNGRPGLGNKRRSISRLQSGDILGEIGDCSIFSLKKVLQGPRKEIII